ncbi:MAG: family 16 glycosylhydrolase [Catenulispora sp.]|nr:family 16 glycosylhydrolase [Catenulispora sp.]
MARRHRSARGLRTRLAALAAPLALAVTAWAALPDAVAHASAPPTPSGWNQVFLDDFNGASGSGIDGQWMYDTGPGSNFGTGEIETMTNSTANVHLDGGGNLDITALGSGGNWTSGRVQTTSANVGAPAGGKLMVTASIQQPGGGLGYWPAFWMLGPGQWPENGEIDIMEDVNALSEVAGTIHCGMYPGGVCNEGNGIGSGLRGCGGCQSGFHTYTMVLDRTNTSAESISFSLDGSQYFSVNESQVGTSTWQQAFDHNLSIILDLAMGGAFPNGACGCTTPTGSTASGGTMQVDYVAAYTTTGGGNPPPPGSGPIYSAVGSNICLDDRGSSTANYNPVQIYGCNGTAAQQWTVVQAGSTLHVLGKCLDVYAGGTANGTKVDLYDCNNTAAQVFIPQSNGSLYNPQSGRCLDVPSATTTWSTQVQIWDCNGTNAQRWTLP